MLIIRFQTIVKTRGWCEVRALVTLVAKLQEESRALTSAGYRDGTSRSERERQSTRVLLMVYNEKNQGWIRYYV